MNFILAQKYNVAGLFRICVDFWHLDVNNVLFILEQAQFLKYQVNDNLDWIYSSTYKIRIVLFQLN